MLESLSVNGRAAEEPKDELSTGERMLKEHIFLGQPHVPGKSDSRADCVFLVVPVVRTSSPNSFRPLSCRRCAAGTVAEEQEQQRGKQ